MKPLELTIYPKSRGMFGPQYDLPDGRHMLAREGADVMSRHKRLTDAELAAEVWHSIVRFNSLCPSPQAAEEARRNAVIDRFATLPHYDQQEDKL